MAEIIQFPVNKRQENESTMEWDGITLNEVLNEAKYLIWEDPEAFFSLEANCYSPHPVKMDPRVEEKLKKLKLIDDSGISPLVVRDAFDKIMESTIEALSRSNFRQLAHQAR
ncbi:hypothetical protein IKG33_02055 [Candidatus Saccharibacteria bacterium]|nr:hypothetical protein [Candidatus Saccharibacteria bacterium]